MTDQFDYDAILSKITNIIESKGHAIIGTVSENENSPSTLSYTVGLTHKGLPDLMMMGFEHGLMQQLLNDAVLKMKDMGKITDPTRLSEVVRNYDVLLVPVPSHEAEKFAHVLKAYSAAEGKEEIELVQIILPDENGLFPNDDGCEQSIALVQDRMRLTSKE